MTNPSRAVLFHGDSSEFELAQIPPIELQKGEILVNVSCCTICGSDLHTYNGRRSVPSPCVLGHEIVGTVEEWFGDEPPMDHFGNPIRLGQRITWGLSASCGVCSICQNGLPQKCLSLFKYGHSKFDGRSAGGLADHCVLVPGTPIFPIANNVADKVACPANCATATVMASLRMAEEITDINGKRILITGLGMLGLTACAVCKSKNAKQIVAVDTKNDRRKLAIEFGANETISPDAITKNKTEQEYDISLELSGAESAINTCISSLAIGGIAILAGSVFPSKHLEINPETLVRRILTIRGIHNYRPGDLASALQFLEANCRKFPFEKLIGQEFGLNQIINAFETADAGKTVRVAVIPSLDY